MGDVEHPAWLKALPVAPEFHPTEAEFVDPTAYILKIEETAKQYGICKIIPPYTKAAKKVVVNNLNRSLVFSSNALGSAVNCSGLRQSRRMGRVMCGSQLPKPKSLVLDSCLEAEDKEPGGSVVNKEFTANSSLSKAKFATRKQQLGWNPKRARGVGHSQNHKLVWQSGESYTLEQFETRAKLFARSRLGSVKDVSHLAIETLFWRAAADKPISVEYANDIPGSAFAESTDCPVLTPMRFKKRKRITEDADQRNGPKSLLRSRSMDLFLEEEEDEEELPAAADEFDPSDTSRPKIGALDATGDNAGGAGSKLANSPWNMRNVARSNGSLLRFMPEEVPGVTTPMVYIGMLFSWFAWHVEDHELHSLNYLHTGASKTWYAVPGDAAPALEEAIRVHGYGGCLNRRAAFSLLGEKTTVMSPEVLVALGVPCCRLVQNVGEYVVTFPRAYHLGFSHGFNCGEAANFATPGWLEVAKDAAARRAAMNSPPMLSHQQLLYHLTISLPQRVPASCPSEPRSSRLKVRQKSIGEEMVKSTYLQDVAQNNELLKVLLEHGVSRCILAIDSVRPEVFTALQDESTRRGLAEQSCLMESPAGVVAPELYTQCGDSSHVPVQHGSGTVETEGDFQHPSQGSVPCARGGAVSEELSEENCGEIRVSTGEDCRSASPGILFSDGAPCDAGANPFGARTMTAASLGIDWGTLPCAACGILCYATMAVVQPTASAAMSFKPIFAAAGLEHCVFEVEDPVRTSAPLREFLTSMPTPVVDSSKYLNPLQSANPSGPVRMDGTSTFWDTSLRLPGRTKTAALLNQKGGTDQRTFTPGPGGGHPNSIQRNQDLLAGASDSGVGQVELSLGNLDVRVSNSAMESGLKFDVGPTLANCRQDPSLENCVDLSNLLSDSEYITQGDLEICDVLGIDSAANLASTASPTLHLTEPSAIPRGGNLPKAYPVQSVRCVGDEDYFGAPAGWDGKEKQQETASFMSDVGKIRNQGLSTLQLLASNYDDNSEDEDAVAPNGCGSLGEEKAVAVSKENVVNDGEKNAFVDCQSDDTKGGEVCAKPDSGVGYLFTDVVGVSADVIGLTLFSVTGISNVPAPPASGDPVFTYSSLVEGPKALENVFVSAGFCFGDGTDPTSVGSLTEERLIDGQIGDDNQAMNMGDLYDRINSQALTFDSDGDEQMMIHFGLRPDLLQESLDLDYCRSIIAGQVDCLQQLETGDNIHFGKGSSPGGTTENIPILTENPSLQDNKNVSLAQADEMLQTGIIKQLNEEPFTEAKSDMEHVGGIKRWNEEASVDGRSGITSGPLGLSRPQTNDHSVESGLRVIPERKVSMSKACRSVARPRILCLEHAVAAQQKLKDVGGAHVLIVCHSDFENFELRAKHLTQELEEEHTWTEVPFSRATDDELNMINTAVYAEDEENRKVNDWVTQMGLFVHDRFTDRQIESSDESEDEGGGMARGRPSRVGRPKLMTSKSLPILDGEYAEDEATIDMKKTAKVSKKKTCTIAGKWCGKVWRFNQVHPLLGGCKKVDQSQLGMSSRSLYSLSLMADSDGGRNRKGCSSSKVEGYRDLLVPAKIAEDQPSALVRSRSRKRKVLDPGAPVQPDKASESHRRLETLTGDRPQSTLTITGVNVEPGEHTAFPKLRTLTGIVSNVKNIAHVCEEASTPGDGLGSSGVLLPTPGKLPILVSETDANGLPILSPIPLSARDSTGSENVKTGLHITISTEVQGAELATMIGKDAAVVPIIPTLALNDIRGEPNGVALDDGVWHKTASLTNVYSTLRHGGKSPYKRKKGKPGNVASSSAGKKKKNGGGSGLSYVWHDAPVVYSSSVHPAMTSGRTGQHSSQMALPPQNEHEHVYIPDISTAQWGPMTDHPLVCESSCNDLYSSSNTFANLEDISGKLQNRGLMEGKPVVEETLGAELLGPIFDQGTAPNVSALCSSEKPAVSMEHRAAVEPLDIAMPLEDQQKRDEQDESVHLEDNSMVAASLSSMLMDRATRSDTAVSTESRPHGYLGSASNQPVLESSIAQEMMQDVKNVVKLPGSIESFTSALVGELNCAGHLQVCLSQEGAGMVSRSDPVRLQDGHVFEKTQAFELTPILCVPHSGMTSPPQGTLGGSGPLDFADITGQGIQLENQAMNPVPRRTSSRGRSAVKARGKRPKNVGWTNYKPPANPQMAASPQNAWQLTLHSPPNAIVESVGTYFDENSEKAIVLRDEFATGAIVPSNGGQALGIADDEEGEEDEDDDVQEPGRNVLAKSKKKTKPKKKRVVPNKKALHEDGEFQCDLEGCRMSFDTEAELQIHKRNRCTFKGCGKRFFIHKYLLQHRRVHMDDRPLKCPWKGCKQSFKWAWARTEHIRVHTGERPYLCPECDQTFRFVSDFSRHKRNTGHTKN